MMVGMEGLRKELLRDIRALGKPGGNPAAQRYLGSPFPVLGLSSPQMQRIVRDFVRTHRDLDTNSVNGLVVSLWNEEPLEEKWAAISILGRYHKVWDAESWRIVDHWVDSAVGWGLCDALGSGPIADMAYRDPIRFREVLRWTRSKNFWRRRISTYAMRAFVRAGELDKPFVLLERLLHDGEFWVQRAVGTWLRECWKKDERRTAAFLRKHARGLPPVTITVATERAPKAFRQELRWSSKGKRNRRP
ncbi:MAG: DNA alkylation repair protein [Methanobacteriota archaeon]|nr:MAG: DNA alkylation repair protein [Euryarchaeota archaeon]